MRQALVARAVLLLARLGPSWVRNGLCYFGRVLRVLRCAGWPDLLLPSACFQQIAHGFLCMTGLFSCFYSANGCSK